METIEKTSQNKNLITRPATAAELEQANQRISTSLVKELLKDYSVVSEVSDEIEHERRALTSLFLWEFEQVNERCKDRAEKTVQPDGTLATRLVFRSQDGNRADERFLLISNATGALVHAECVTDFGNPGELRRRVIVDQTGFSVQQEAYHYDGDSGVGQSTWQEADPEQAVATLLNLSNTMTESMVKFIERSAEENEAADQKALTIQRHLGLRAVEL